MTRAVKIVLVTTPCASTIGKAVMQLKISSCHQNSSHLWICFSVGGLVQNSNHFLPCCGKLKYGWRHQNRWFLGKFPKFQRGKGGGHSGLNQGVRPSYYNFQISPRTLCRISTDCFAETPVTVSFDHILCTFWSINMRRFTHQMTNH